MLDLGRTFLQSVDRAGGATALVDGPLRLTLFGVLVLLIPLAGWLERLLGLRSNAAEAAEPTLEDLQRDQPQPEPVAREVVVEDTKAAAAPVAIDPNLTVADPLGNVVDGAVIAITSMICVNFISYTSLPAYIFIPIALVTGCLQRSSRSRVIFSNSARVSV